MLCNKIIYLYTFFVKLGTPLLALTGTADSKTQKTIVWTGNERSCPVIWDPNRPNIKFIVVKVKKPDLFKEMDWIIEMIRHREMETLKTIIFCPSLTAIVTLANCMMMKLEEQAFHPNISKKRENCLIGIFTLLLTTNTRRQFQIPWRQMAPRELLWWLLLSVCGLTSQTSDMLCYGAHKEVSGFPSRGWKSQKGWLAIRCNSILLWTRGILLCIQLFLKTSDCQHVGAYALPDPHISPVQLSHDCCNNCSLMCSCEPDGCTDTCQGVRYMWEEPNIQLSAKTRNVSAEDKATLVEAAHELKSILNTSVPIKVPVFGLTALHGFSEQLIEDIAENCHKFFYCGRIIWLWTCLFP